MKNAILGLVLLTGFSQAAEAVVWPNVYNWGNRVEVQVFNNTDRSVWCSGSVYLRMESNKEESHYFSEFINRGMFVYRSIYPRTLSERIQRVNHSIFCN